MNQQTQAFKSRFLSQVFELSVGTAAGADCWASAYTLAGVALAGGGTNFRVKDPGSPGIQVFQRDLALRWLGRGAAGVVKGGTPPPAALRYPVHHAFFSGFRRPEALFGLTPVKHVG